METNKRKLTCNQSLEERKRKLTNAIDQSITSMENLSNEFFYEIFDYLDGCDIYQAFSHLNYRFQNLLNSSALLLKIIFHRSTSELKFVTNYREIIRFNKSQILSIHFLSSVHNQFILSLDIDSSFTHLESIFLDSIQPNTLTLLLRKLTHLPRLFSLTIDTSKILNDLTDIYRLIFDLPKLKYIRFFTTMPGFTYATVSLPFRVDQQFSNIKHIIIDHSCYFNEIFSIISYTPHISYLSFILKGSSSEILSPMILSNLTYLSIYGDDIRFNEFEMFITKIYPKLKFLSLGSGANDMTYLNGDRWEQLILKYLPELEKFDLTCSMRFPNRNKMLKYVGKSNPFNSPFWIERQWLFEVDISLDTVIYSIHPYKKRWYEYGSQHEMSKSMRLVFTIIPYYKQYYALRYISTIVDIYHLEIYEEVYTNTLMEILVLLPDLDSFQISTLPYSNPRYMTDEERKRLSVLRCQNQIKKVYLKKMMNIEEIYFLLELCPHMTYLKVDYFNNMNIGLFIRLILMKITCSNHQLRLLCFRIKAADDRMIEKLYKMVNFEKLLLLDYTIKRISDNIYLEWK